MLLIDLAEPKTTFPRKPLDQPRGSMSSLRESRKLPRAKKKLKWTHRQLLEHDSQVGRPRRFWSDVGDSRANKLLRKR